MVVQSSVSTLPNAQLLGLVEPVTYKAAPQSVLRTEELRSLFCHNGKLPPYREFRSARRDMRVQMVQANGAVDPTPPLVE